MGYRNIVVGTDGSPTASTAVRHASDLAARAGARLIVVTAYHHDLHGETQRATGAPDDVRWALTDRAEADRIATTGRDTARAAGVPKVVLRAEEGDPAGTILSTAKEFDADLIVVGSVGMTSSARFLLGSVASDVSHHAPCDVLVVRTDGHLHPGTHS